MKVLIVLLLLCFGLAGFVIVQASMQSVGAVELRDDQHMNEFLSQKPFGVRVDGGPAIVLTFSDDGTFVADGLRSPGVVPEITDLPWINLSRQRHGLAPESFEFLDALFPMPEGGSTDADRPQRRTGTWQADVSVLTLSPAPLEGVPPGDLATPRGWVDGKLRIEIGGIRLMKTEWPTEASPRDADETVPPADGNDR